jgi:glycosyltransferase involved in cell wall biosynthesis
MSTSYQPKVAVIVVSRNRRAYLDELLNSLLKQTFKNFEIILVDNASQPETRQFVEDLTLPIPLKRVFLDQEQTISYCRNYPFEQDLINTHVKYIYFIDDDDAIFSYTLKAMVDRIEQTNAHIVCANSIRVYCTEKMLEKTYRYIRFKDELRPLLIHAWRLSLSKILFPDKRWMFVRHVKSAMAIHSLLFDINLLKRHRFQQEITYGEDSMLYFDMAPSVKQVSTLPYIFVLYRRHGNNCGDPHNFVRKVRANPLSIDFCWGHYPLPDCYMIFFQEYVEYQLEQAKRGIKLTQTESLSDDHFRQLSQQTPLSTKMATALLYPHLAVRFAFFRLGHWSRATAIRLLSHSSTNSRV